MTIKTFDIITIGKEFQKEGNVYTALQILNLAKKIANQLKQIFLIPSCLQAIADSFYYLGLNEIACNYYYSYYIHLKLNSLIEKAIRFEKSYDYIHAKECYEKSLELFDKYEIKENRGTIIGNLGLVHENLGNYKKSFVLYKEALEYCEKDNDTIGLGAIYNNIGMVLSKLNRYDESLQYFNKSLDFRNEVDDKEGIACTLHNIGGVYLTKGNFKEASNNFERSMDIYKKIKKLKGYFLVLNSYTNILERKGKISEAITNYIECIENFKNGRYLWELGLTYNNLGLLYKKAGFTNKSLKCFKAALNISHEIENPSLNATILNNLASLL